MNFADSNWLTALYLSATDADTVGKERERIVERFARKHGGQLAVSHVTLLETANIFRRITRQAQPVELEELTADFSGRLFVDAMNWHLLRAQCEAVFARYSAKAELGTFDCAIIASARLAGATRFLSFDEKAKAVAVAEGLAVFPELKPEGKRLLARLRN